MFLSRRRPASARGHHTPGRAQPRRSADARLPPLTKPVSVDRPVRCCDRGVWRRWRRGTGGSGSRRLWFGRPAACPVSAARRGGSGAPCSGIPPDDGRDAASSLQVCRTDPRSGTVLGLSGAAAGLRTQLRDVRRAINRATRPAPVPRRRLFFYIYYLEIKHGALVVGCRAQRNRDGRCGAACASSLVARLRQCECPFKRPRPPSRSGRPRGKRPIQRIQRSERARGAPVGRSRG